MFVQVIRGPLREEGEGLEMLESWMDDLRPGAIGWLGTTAGVTPEGELVVVARFGSEEEARRNSDRPEQGEWWARMEKRFAGPVTFRDCADVALLLEGGSDDAGFVQVIEAPALEPVTATELADATNPELRRHRPDVLGGIAALSNDGYLCQVVYFTSEAEARANEANELPEESQAAWDAFAQRLGEVRYYDLPSPLLLS